MYGTPVPAAAGRATRSRARLNEKGKNMGGWRYGQANGDADLSATQFVLLAMRAASQAGYPLEKRARSWTGAGSKQQDDLGTRRRTT